MDVQEMVIYGVSFDVIGKQPIVLLKTMEGNRFLPIWIGHPEAAAILIKLQGTKLPRPMTHDLLANVLGRFHADVARITVTELKESTFYATLTLDREGELIEIDSRPSDALALAVRTDAPIFASTTLIEDNAIEFEREVDDTEEIVDSFRDFLDTVSPDDFLSAEGTPNEIAEADRGDEDEEADEDEDEDEDEEDDEDEDLDEDEEDDQDEDRGN
jgi:bifunctional DNase/RNase